ncbi:MAG TPA: ABC transporter ATP-binding protein [Lacisediminihabitans sp.]|uniref:ABC transporter ATP-binding protein n=1 Tax=Lacisediminihabitans sp. TaxID=2787631 RepID=UPI002EDABDCD
MPEQQDPIAVRVTALSITTTEGDRTILPPIDLAVARGEIVGLAGETGSGKTTLGLSLLGYQRQGLRLAGGNIIVHDEDLTGAGAAVLRGLRGDRIAYVPQDPATALNPALRIRESFVEVMSAHGLTDGTAQRERMTELFASVGLPSTDAFLARFPHQLSGGQQQRFAIAIAFAMHPAVVVMDEPTTGLDASTKLTVMALIKRLSAEHHSSVVLISHDLRMLIAFTDRIVVMREGRIVDDTTSATLAESATDPYTHRLLAALPDPLAHRTIAAVPTGERALLRVAQLVARHGAAEITHGVGLTIDRGECLAVVGESGSGKTTLARSIAGLHSDYSGLVRWEGRPLERSLSRRSRDELGAIQYVFQNPYSSLNPRRNVGNILATAARVSRGRSAAESRELAAEMLESVGLETRHLLSMPGSLSGGQRQRVALARALMTRPDLLICDEITSSLDVSVQAEIVALLQRLQRDRGLSMLFITHDLALVSSVASRVLVLRDGSVVENGRVEQVLERPADPYTKRLLSVAE